nr:myosin2 [Tanacetum cinerariifolium]
MEAIRISCAGFPTRKPFHEFVERFKILSPNVIKLSDEVEASKILLEKANLQGYQIGKTKVFLRAGQMAEIDARRSEVLGRSATKIQAKFRGNSACKKFILLRSAAIPLQTICRGEVARLFCERRRKERACLRIQKIARMRHERNRYKVMSSSVIFIQNGMRGMAARNAYHSKRRTKAAIGIQSRCRRHLAVRRYLKMRKVAIYAQSVARKDMARMELKNLKKAAKDTSDLQDAKSKLEREVKKLALRLQEEERIRVKTL